MTPGYEPTSRDEDTVRSAVERAIGGPIPPIEFRRRPESERRDCQCPARNPDCEHPTCPRWPQPGHFVAAAAELVEEWETGGKGYADLEQRIAVALAKAATR